VVAVAEPLEPMIVKVMTWDLVVEALVVGKVVLIQAQLLTVDLSLLVVALTVMAIMATGQTLGVGMEVVLAVEAVVLTLMMVVMVAVVDVELTLYQAQ
tara:strand:+ start:209 stop:502 length:294 start_codon:yes stop_codon:yes gene_type:complete